MSGFNCPFCSMVFPETNDTKRYHNVSFFDSDIRQLGQVQIPESNVDIWFYKCPNCGNYTITAKGSGKLVKEIDTVLQPNSFAKQYPNYIPEAIRKDYSEACAIAKLSPKASATLSRRCLQGMIHDFWNIKLKNLNQEITALKEKIPADLWSSIDALRQLGNIGAHMEKDTDIIVDIDPDEANRLIKLIELLMKEWYIARQDRAQLFTSILATNEAKQKARKKTE